MLGKTIAIVLFTCAAVGDDPTPLEIFIIIMLAVIASLTVNWVPTANSEEENPYRINEHS